MANSMDLGSVDRKRSIAATDANDSASERSRRIEQDKAAYCEAWQQHGGYDPRTMDPIRDRLKADGMRGDEIDALVHSGEDANGAASPADTSHGPSGLLALASYPGALGIAAPFLAGRGDSARLPAVDVTVTAPAGKIPIADTPMTLKMAVSVAGKLEPERRAEGRSVKVDISSKGLKLEAERVFSQEIAKLQSGGVTVKGVEKVTRTATGAEVQVGVTIGGKYRDLTFKVNVASLTASGGELEFKAVEGIATIPLGEKELEIGGTKAKLSGDLSLKLTLSVEAKELLEWAAEKAGKQAITAGGEAALEAGALGLVGAAAIYGVFDSITEAQKFEQPVRRMAVDMQRATEQVGAFIRGAQPTNAAEKIVYDAVQAKLSSLAATAKLSQDDVVRTILPGEIASIERAATADAHAAARAQARKMADDFMTTQSWGAKQFDELRALGLENRETHFHRRAAELADWAFRR